jgi:hypothetical protein
LRPEYQERVAELSGRLWQWMKQVDDPILKGPLRTPYYEDAMRDFQQFRTT